ncbi:hypothetical protein JOD02_000894 [Caldicoprobacter guelmensis]|nr:hypothetical protein [Caldicoprobacter guelmensis]
MMFWVFCHVGLYTKMASSKRKLSFILRIIKIESSKSKLIVDVQSCDNVKSKQNKEY